MTESARTDATKVDWSIWAPGVGAPLALILADVAIGGHVMKLAPATALALTAIGIASLAISRNYRQAVAGLAAVGPMWIVTGVALALGATFAAFTGLAVLATLATPGSLAPKAILGGAILGLIPLWTGVTFLREARALTENQVTAFGRRRTGVAALAGSLTVMAVVYGTLVFDSGLTGLSGRAL